MQKCIENDLHRNWINIEIIRKWFDILKKFRENWSNVENG